MRESTNEFSPTTFFANLRIGILPSLLTSLISLTLLLAGALFAVTLEGSARVAEDLARNYLEKSGKYIESRIESFFSPVQSALRQTREWAREGLLDPADERSFQRLLLPLLRFHPQVTSLCAGDETGFSHRLGADGENYLCRIVTSPGASAPARFALFDEICLPLKNWTAPDNYDIRQRDWFKGASDTAPFWSNPFFLHTSRSPGIAASLRLPRPNASPFVIGFNLMLTGISDFSTSIKPSPQGMTMIVADSGELLGVPGIPEFASATARRAFLESRSPGLPTVDDLKMPVFNQGWKSWNRQPSTFSLPVDGRTWWFEFHPHRLSDEDVIWICLAVPDDDFLGEARRQQRNIIVVGLLSVLAAVLMSILLARMYSRPLYRLARQSEEITALDLSPKEPIDSHLLEVHLLVETQARMVAALTSFSRYVPTEVVRQLLERGEAARLGARPSEISVTFCDIRDFTTLSESLELSILSEHLAEYFANLMRIFQGHRGTIDKMIGDAIMTLWGAPSADREHALQAVTACLHCREFLTGFNARCAERGLPPLETRFGITTGTVLIGNFGAPDRMNFTAIGDTVNLASRLEGLNKLYGTSILAAEPTRLATGETFVWRLVDLAAVKGKTQPVRIYEPLGEAGKVPEETLAFARSYEAAFAAYLNREFDKVPMLLEPACSLRPDDRSVATLRSNAADFLRQPPPPDWQGVTYQRTK